MTRVSAALAWDGARVPVGKLPAGARKFLGQVTPAAKLAKLIHGRIPVEIRICWVPELRGGDGVFLPPFDTEDGKRIGFRAVRTTRFGDILGVVYHPG